jgi:hypothetical protein
MPTPALSANQLGHEDHESTSAAAPSYFAHTIRAASPIWGAVSKFAKSLTNFPQRRRDRKAASSNSKSNAPKRELRTAYSHINPRIEFHDSDWSAIESAGGITLCPEKRDKIRLISWGFVLAHAAAHNAFDADEIEQHIRSVIEHAEALMKSLQIRHHFATIDDWVATEIIVELLGDNFSRTLVETRHFAQQQGTPEFTGQVNRDIRL